MSTPAGAPVSEQRSASPPPAGNVGHDFQLHLLNFGKALPLARNQMIHLFMQVPDLQFGLEIDAVIAL